MSSYIKSPFKQSPVLAVSGKPTYLFGSFDDRSAPTIGTLISDSGNGTVSTVTYQTLQGNIPLVGDLATIISSANASGGYNVTNAPILSVSTTDNGVSGVVTITFDNTANSALASDIGQIEILRSEIGEVFANGASAPCAVAPNNSAPQQGRTLTLSVEVAGSPTAGTVDLQGANFDLDSEYETLSPVAGGSTTGHAYDASPSSTNPGGEASYADYTMNYRFYRVIVTSVTGGTNPTIVAKLEN